MPYTQTSFLQLKSLLAQRLSDSGFVFWSSAELGLNIQLSLRLWNSLTGYYKTRWTFNPSSGNFYDLPSISGSPLAYTLKDQDLISWMEFYLLEPQTVVWDGSWLGTSMFSLADLEDALEKRLNEFLFMTGAIITHPTPIPGVTTGRLPLDQSIIDIRRAEWQPYSQPSAHYPIENTDPLEMQNLIPSWSYNPARPQGYMLYPTPLLTLQLAPVPNVNGILDLLTINSHAPLDSTGSGTLLSMFQDLLPYIFFGSMATLLSQVGPSYDPERAAYCEQRWQEGVALVTQRIFTSVFYGELQGIPIPLRSTYDLDFLTPNWTVGTERPSQIAMQGLNMLALAPAPDAGPYSILLDLVQPAPVPVANSDLVQLGREEIQTILDEAEHLSMFKRGGNEFLSTTPLHQSFLSSAMEYNDRLRAEAKNFKFLQQQATEEENDRPRRVKQEEI